MLFGRLARWVPALATAATLMVTFACCWLVVSSVQPSVLVADQPKAKPRAAKPVKAKPITTANSPGKKKAAHGPLDPPEPPVVLPTKKVKLTEGVEVEMEEYGETYLGYDFREPVLADDWQRQDSKDSSKGFRKTDPAIETVIDYRESSVLRVDHGINGFTVDPVHQKLYWTDRKNQNNGGQVYQANCDGSGLKVLVRDLAAPMSVAIDSTHGKLYFATFHDIHRVDVETLKVDHIMGGLDCPGGIAVDPDRGYVYVVTEVASRPWRIFRCRLDGSERMVLMEDAGGPELTLDPVHQMLYWIDTNNKLRRSDVDGKHQQIIVDRTRDFVLGHIRGLAIDPAAGKLYLDDEPYGIIRRVNLDGSQFEQLIIGSNRADGVGVDPAQGYVYWVDNIFVGGTSVYNRIRRIRNPPYPKSVEKPAPPLITSWKPSSVKAGDTLQVSGRFFGGTVEAAVVGVGTGEYANARFQVDSNESLSVVIPELKQSCREFAIVVRTPGGVTTTIPKSSLTYDRKTSHSDRERFDAWAKNQKFTIVVNPGCAVTDVERSIIYVTRLGTVSVRGEGQNTIFLKNSASTTGLTLDRCVVFHEPFANINALEKVPIDTRRCSVSAIRPCLVDSLPALIR